MALDATRIETNIRKLRKILKKSSKLLKPQDVHRLRTRTRRMEAILTAVGLSSDHSERQLLRRLGRIRKKAGKVRDMDVLTSHACAIKKMNAGCDCLLQLIEYLGAQRYRFARKLRQSIQRHSPKTRRRLKRTSARLERIIDHDQENSSDMQTDPHAQAAGLARKLSMDLAAPAILNRSNLHSYRIKIKELRYVLQTEKGDRDRQFMDALGESKDAIGEWHDWEQMIAIAAELLDHEPECTVLTTLRTISREKYDLALSVTNRMREQYVKRNNSGKDRSFSHSWWSASRLGQKPSTLRRLSRRGRSLKPA
ncbi:MAG TPA: CHAD domain-containing protein [Candidatus Acidoferrales bacterium]|nr:CHAD domain-containing protein [Candidatus Acidoferrales bacterium]